MKIFRIKRMASVLGLVAALTVAGSGSAFAVVEPSQPAPVPDGGGAGDGSGTSGPGTYKPVGCAPSVPCY